jgi:hypothetical protein
VISNIDLFDSFIILVDLDNLSKNYKQLIQRILGYTEDDTLCRISSNGEDNKVGLYPIKISRHS